MTNEEAIKALNHINLVRVHPFLDWEEMLEVRDKAISALEKQIPKKPRKTRCCLMCSNCNHKITEKGCIKSSRNYCKNCGQAIDWSE